MGFLAALGAAVPDLLGSAFSLFGANKARQQAKGDAFNKFADLRDAAINGGFNPLTALQATGGAGFGAYPSSAPPLASVELLTGGLQKASDEVTGVAAQRRAADRLNLDMAQLRLDQARSGVVAYAPRSAAGGVGSGPPALGRSAVTVATTARGGVRVGMGPPGPVRKTEVKPIGNESGWTAVENDDTYGKIWLPTVNDEVVDVATGPVVAVYGAPQYLRNRLSYIWGAIKKDYSAPVKTWALPSTLSNPGNPPRDYSKDRAKASDWWKHQFPSN